MRKIFALCLVFTMLFAAVSAAELSVSAKAAVVIEAESGRVLYSKNMNEKLGMASTTKIMTALVALEKGNTEEVVTVSEHAANVEGSSMYLKTGEKITLGNLLYGLMLQSGNDAATAIAEHIAGSEEKFAALMNKEAEKIGAENTHFTNPHGLADEEHYTTAYDLAKIAAYALKNPKFAEIVAAKSITLEREGQGRVTLTNHNKLLRMYDGCIGVKTGFTKATGRCLVTASRRGKMTVVCVTLNAGDDWNDHMAMSNYAFKNYNMALYKREGTVAAAVRVKNGMVGEVNGIFAEDIYLPEKDENEWELEIDIPRKISAPVAKGSVIGKITAKGKNGETEEFDIAAEKDVAVKADKNGNNILKNIVNVYRLWLEIFVQM